MQPLTVRPARPEEAQDLYDLSIRAILQSASDHYTDRQLRAWAGRRSVDAHRRMIDSTATFVAADGAQVAGFLALALTAGDGLVPGEIDQLFVDPAHGGRGAARLLLEHAELVARSAGLPELITHASSRAAPVFRRSGFTEVGVETVTIDDQVLTRTLMRAPLPHDAA